MQKSSPVGSSFLAALSLVLVLIIFPRLSFSLEEDRSILMFTLSTLNLTALGLNAWAGAQIPAPKQNSKGKHIPNDTLSPDSPDWILFEKIIDATPSLSVPKGIKTLPRWELIHILREVEEKNALSTDSFAYRAYLHLKGKYLDAEPITIETSAEGEYHYLSSPSLNIENIDATLNPFLNLREGDFSEEGHNGWLGTTVRNAPLSWLTYELSPHGLFSSQERRDQKHAEFYLRRGYLKANINHFEIELGRDTTQWGFGREGTLLLSGNAEPFYLLRLGNSRPTVLPGFLKYLGPMRIDFFAATLDDERVRQFSILQGTKFTFLPHPRWEIGFANTIQLGGENSEGTNPGTYFSEKFFGGNTDRNFSINSRYRIPILEIEPYFELGWEDCCEPPQYFTVRDTMHIVGVYIPRFGKQDQFDFAAEWVRTEAITYSHSFYSSGFEYRGRLIGHPIGPNADGVYGIFRYFHSPTTWLKLIGGIEARDHGSINFNEYRYRVTSTLAHELTEGLRFQLQGGYERVANFDFQQGVNRNNFIAGINLQIF